MKSQCVEFHPPRAGSVCKYKHLTHTCHTVTLSQSHTVTLAHCHNVILSHCHTVILTYFATMSHSHTVILLEATEVSKDTDCWHRPNVLTLNIWHCHAGWCVRADMFYWVVKRRKKSCVCFSFSVWNKAIKLLIWIQNVKIFLTSKIKTIPECSMFLCNTPTSQLWRQLPRNSFTAARKPPCSPTSGLWKNLWSYSPSWWHICRGEFFTKITEAFMKNLDVH